MTIPNEAQVKEALKVFVKDHDEDIATSEKIKKVWQQKFWQFMVPDWWEDEIIGAWRLDHFGPIRLVEELRSFLQGQWIDSTYCYTRLSYREGNRWVPMMSDTPSEMYDLLPYYNMLFMTGAKRVLINGLGLGCAIPMALWHGAEHIHVVEHDEDVIELTGKYYQGDDRITIIHEDAFTVKWPTGMRWDVVWHDIWPKICTDNSPEITRLKRKYGSRCSWQGAWSEDRIKGMHRKYKRWKRAAERSKSAK